MDHARLISGIIVLIAGFSDWLDGWIARTFDMKTKVGAALDPLADKLMSLTVLLTLVQVRIIPLWFFLGLLLKEALLIAGGLWLYFRGIHESIPSQPIWEAGYDLLLHSHCASDPRRGPCDLAPCFCYRAPIELDRSLNLY